jgi:hypothetical protein
VRSACSPLRTCGAAFFEGSFTFEYWRDLGRGYRGLAGLGHHNTAATESLSLHNTAPENHHHNHFEQRQPARNWLVVSTSEAVPAHTEGPTSIAATLNSSLEDASAHVSAATIVPRANGALPPPGINGLRFTSLETAIAAARISSSEPSHRTITSIPLGSWEEAVRDSNASIILNKNARKTRGLTEKHTRTRARRIPTCSSTKSSFTFNLYC